VDFRRAYWGMAALMAALLLSILAALPAPAPRQFSNPGAPPPLAGWQQAVSRRGIPLFFLLAAFFYLAVGFELAFSGWITTYLRQDARVSGSASGLGLSTFWLAMVAGRILGAELSRRWSKGRLVSACAVTASAGVLILLLVGGAHASLAAIAVVGLGVAPLFPTGLAIAGEHYPAAVGTVSGIYFAVGSLGGMTIPWLLGEVAGAAGSLAWGMSIHLLLGALILATMAAVGFYRPGE
jgi:fucose permease